MNGKPADFFVGVIDLFAILLPGAIVGAMLRPHLAGFLFGPDGLLPPLEQNARPSLGRDP
jgi:hypothetical protein